MEIATHDPQPVSRTGKALRLAGLFAFMAGLFIADTLTDLEIAIGVLYVAVPLVAASFLPTRAILLLSGLCLGLLLTSYELTSGGDPTAGPINRSISVIVVIAATMLVLRIRPAILAGIAAREQLARVARINMLGELTASIAHEVNQPLAAIANSGNAGLRWLEAQPPNLDKARQALARVVSDAERAASVIARVRSLARPVPPHREWLNALDTVEEIIALIRDELARNQVTLTIESGEGMPPVLADKVQVQQVLLNLILNAVEAMGSTPPAGRTLRIRISLAEGGQALFSVQDRGIGLKTDNVEKLFDAFHTTKPDGMGIGLAVTRSIVETHGGKVWATANEEGGASFHFTLPTSRTDIP